MKAPQYVMHSAVDGHLSWFQLGAVHTKAAEKAGGPERGLVMVAFEIRLGPLPRQSVLESSQMLSLLDPLATRMET